MKNNKLLYQFFPVLVCAILLFVFVQSTNYFVDHLINPFNLKQISRVIGIKDVLVGFFLYFVTAIDYALIVGRMSVTNQGFKARFVMNVFTCIGCFVGVTGILFLWGYAKEFAAFIVPLLIFAGSVMIKLAYEGHEYFLEAKSIPTVLRKGTFFILQHLYKITRVFTFWMPELGSPKVTKMSIGKLAQWSFFLPFIIGVDDLVGYMGAMTIYNAYGLIIGIYLADILIDILIFVSPKMTKKLVENAFLSLLAAWAFLYLGYKSYSEVWLVAEETWHVASWEVVAIVIALIVGVVVVDEIKIRKGGNISEHVRGR
jgi:hypothetical protein